MSDWEFYAHKDADGHTVALFHKGPISLDANKGNGTIVYKNSRMKMWGKMVKNMRKAKGKLGVITEEGVQVYGRCIIKVPKRRKLI